MVKRGLGVDLDAIPEAEQLEAVDLIWNAPEADVLSIGEIFAFEREWEPEIMASCPAPPATRSPRKPTCAWSLRSTCAFRARATRDKSAGMRFNTRGPVAAIGSIRRVQFLRLR